MSIFSKGVRICRGCTTDCWYGKSVRSRDRASFIITTSDASPINTEGTEGRRSGRSKSRSITHSPTSRSTRSRYDDGIRLSNEYSECRRDANGARIRSGLSSVSSSIITSHGECWNGLSQMATDDKDGPKESEVSRYGPASR